MRPKFVSTGALVLGTLLSLCGCAAKFTLIDRSDGQVYTGTTDGSTMGGNGTATITIEGIAYVGPWVYQAKDGSFALAVGRSTTGFTGTATSTGQQIGTVNTALSGTASTSSQTTMLMQSAVGNGMVNARAADGHFIRCVFTFNTLNNTGIGQCMRNDGRAYDLQVKR